MKVTSPSRQLYTHSWPQPIRAVFHRATGLSLQPTGSDGGQDLTVDIEILPEDTDPGVRACRKTSLNCRPSLGGS